MPLGPSVLSANEGFSCYGLWSPKSMGSLLQGVSRGARWVLCTYFQPVLEAAVEMLTLIRVLLDLTAT